jgi:hypothetical protein
MMKSIGGQRKNDCMLIQDHLCYFLLMRNPEADL